MLLLYPGELYRLLGASSLIYTFTISGYGYTTTLWPILYYCPCFYFIPLPFQEIGIPQHFGLFYTFTISGDGYTTTLWSILYYGSMFFLILYLYHYRRWVYHNTFVYFMLLVHVFIIYLYHFRRWVYHITLVYFMLWVHVIFNLYIYHYRRWVYHNTLAYFMLWV
jgi:hypothetical protein